MPPASLIHRLAGHRILVVGDLFLDEYLLGRVQRLSREAPVPVLEQTRVEYLPGGAANPAANVLSLGGTAVVVGLVGQDETAGRLQALIAGRGIETILVVDPDRPTTRKTRIVVEGSYVFAHHLARVDHISHEPANSEHERRLRQHVEDLMPGCAAVLVSDYRAGVVTPALIAAIQSAARQHGALTVVDSQGDLAAFAGFDLVRCNRREAMGYLGRTLHTDADYERALVHLVQQLGAGAVVISRGSEGLSLLRQGGVARHLAAANRSQVYDVTGAGDTQIAVITLALAAGLDLRTAAHLGNVAAGLAVQRLGNVTVTPQELIDALSDASPA